MKIYFYAEEWRGRLKVETMRAFSSLPILRAYHKMNRERTATHYQGNTYYHSFRAYEFEDGFDQKPILIKDEELT